MNMTNFPVFIDIEFAFRRLIILPLRLPLQSLFAPLFAPSFCRACLGCEIQALKRNHDFATLTSIDDYSFLVKSPHMAERWAWVFSSVLAFANSFPIIYFAKNMQIYQNNKSEIFSCCSIDDLGRVCEGTDTAALVDGCNIASR